MSASGPQNQQWLQRATGRASGPNETPFGGIVQQNSTPISRATARGVPQASDIDDITYASPISGDQKRPLGGITTLLDLTDRDQQENDIFPLNTETTWFTRDPDRRVIPFTSLIQEVQYRGPATFGQRISFDLGSLLVGDLLFGTILQVHLDHWLDTQAQLLAAAGKLTAIPPGAAWEYANALGASLISSAELEIDGQTIEMIDGDFINVFATLFSDFNTQIPVAFDHLGKVGRIQITDPAYKARLWPNESGVLHCLLPFGFMRTRYQDALPMIAMREGIVRIHVTFRPFEECVRQVRGYRDSCTAVPLNQTLQFTNTITSPATIRPVLTPVAPPPFKAAQLVTYGALLDGPLRTKMLKDPFEVPFRQVQTFFFQEPLKYTVAKGATEDVVRVQLPLEPNHPLDEIIWFVRRRGATDNNDWTNYGPVTERQLRDDRAAALLALENAPLLQRATLQANGVTLCDAEGDYYRQLIAGAHRGGIASYNSFLYGYPFARHPGEHQPSGTLNASRLNSLRLTLDVASTDNWEVKVFCIGINWMRYDNGIANPMFED